MTRSITQILKDLFTKEQIEDLSYEIFPRLNTRPLDIRTAFQFALKRADLTRPGIVFHSLRHTCRTLLGESGATVLDAMKITNHKDMRSSHGYNHPSADHLRGVLERATEEII
jgi:integrase